jgi:hypothetical protein
LLALLGAHPIFHVSRIRINMKMTVKIPRKVKEVKTDVSAPAVKAYR